MERLRFLLVSILIIFSIGCTDNQNYLKLSHKLIDNCGWKRSDYDELAKELKYTHKLCRKYKVDFYTMLAIRQVESSGRKQINAGDYDVTGSYSTYQQTRDNTKQYASKDGYTHEEVSDDVYLSIYYAVIFVRAIKDNVKGEYRQIVSFNRGIGGANKLSYFGVKRNKYLKKVLTAKKQILK